MWLSRGGPVSPEAGPSVQVDKAEVDIFPRIWMTSFGCHLDLEKKSGTKEPHVVEELQMGES